MRDFSIDAIHQHLFGLSKDRYCAPRRDPISLGVITAGSMALTAAGTAISASGTIAGGKVARQEGYEIAAAKREEAGDVAAAKGQQAVAARTMGVLQKQAHDYEAVQLEQNAGGEIAAAQRAGLEKRMAARLAQSTLRARGAGSGVSLDVGSPAATAAAIGQRGEYLALTDVFNGVNTATGLLNRATGTRYAGDMALAGSEFEALGLEREGAAALRAGEREATAAIRSGERKESASKTAAAGTIIGGMGSMLKTYGDFAYPTARRS